MITCIAPKPEQIETVAENQDGTVALIENLTYVYVSPSGCYKADFNPSDETYVAYNRRHHTVRKLLAAIFSRSASRSRHVSKKMNYKID